MNKPLKNSEWKSNRASSYYWITSLWKLEADLSSDSTLNLHRSSWCTAVPVGGHHSLLECQFHCDYPHHRHMWAILPPRTQKTWLGHLSNLLTLQGRWHPPRTSRTQTNQGVRAMRRWANLLRKGEARKLMSPEASQPLSAFFWHWGHFYMLSAPCHSWWYVLTGTQGLLCQELTEYPA